MGLTCLNDKHTTHANSFHVTIVMVQRMTHTWNKVVSSFSLLCHNFENLRWKKSIWVWQICLTLRHIKGNCNLYPLTLQDCKKVLKYIICYWNINELIICTHSTTQTSDNLWNIISGVFLSQYFASLSFRHQHVSKHSKLFNFVIFKLSWTILKT